MNKINCISKGMDMNQLKSIPSEGRKLGNHQIAMIWVRVTLRVGCSPWVWATSLRGTDRCVCSCGLSFCGMK